MAELLSMSWAGGAGRRLLPAREKYNYICGRRQEEMEAGGWRLD
jgi:hypothetical protein